MSTVWGRIYDSHNVINYKSSDHLLIFITFSNIIYQQEMGDDQNAYEVWINFEYLEYVYDSIRQLVSMLLAKSIILKIV